MAYGVVYISFIMALTVHDMITSAKRYDNDNS